MDGCSTLHPEQQVRAGEDSSGHLPSTAPCMLTSAWPPATVSPEEAGGKSREGGWREAASARQTQTCFSSSSIFHKFLVPVTPLAAPRVLIKRETNI